MTVSCRSKKRHGALTVEMALILPAVFVFVFGLVVVGMGVARYQQVAWVARQGARWAAVHGASHEFATGEQAATPQDVYDNAIMPNATYLNSDNITYNVTWSPDNRPGGTVTVTVSYAWEPELFLPTITLGSTSSMTMSY